MKRLGFSKRGGGGSSDTSTNQKLADLALQFSVWQGTYANDLLGVQQQIDYLRNSELTGFADKQAVGELKGVIDTLQQEVSGMKLTLNGYVIKGNNGTWADAPELSRDAYHPTRLSYYNPSTQNRPNSYGVITSFSSKGHFTKQGENWINSVAFGTDGTIKFCQSVNGGQTAWYDIYNEATTPNRQIITNGLQAGKSFRSGGQSIATGFVKGWAKMVVGNAPPPLSGMTVSHPFDRRKIINVSARIDGDGMSFVQGLVIEVHDNYFSIENNTANANTAGKPLTLYIEYEM